MTQEPPMTTAEQHREAITAQAHIVREMRIEQEKQRKAWAEAQKAFVDEHASIVEALTTATASTAVAESHLRNLTLAAFTQDPNNKAPGPGVGIRVEKRVEYDDVEAFTWGLTSGGMGLKLDSQSFERIAKQNPNLSTLAFVTFTEKLTATIAIKLSEALGLPAEGPF